MGVFGLKVTIKFQVPPACEFPQLIANLVSQLGLKVEEHGAGSDMSLRAWDRLSETVIYCVHKFSLSSLGMDDTKFYLCLMLDSFFSIAIVYYALNFSIFLVLLQCSCLAINTHASRKTEGKSSSVWNCEYPRRRFMHPYIPFTHYLR